MENCCSRKVHSQIFFYLSFWLLNFGKISFSQSPQRFWFCSFCCKHNTNFYFRPFKFFVVDGNKKKHCYTENHTCSCTHENRNDNNIVMQILCCATKFCLRKKIRLLLRLQFLKFKGAFFSVTDTHIPEIFGWGVAKCCGFREFLLNVVLSQHFGKRKFSLDNILDIS